MGWLAVGSSPLTPNKMWMGKCNTALVAGVEQDVGRNANPSEPYLKGAAGGGLCVKVTAASLRESGMSAFLTKS